MRFEQTLHDCDEHSGCGVIIGAIGKREVWRSHMPNIEHHEHRLNPDTPDLIDKRGAQPVTLRSSPWCDRCAARRMGGPPRP